MPTRSNNFPGDAAGLIPIDRAARMMACEVGDLLVDALNRGRFKLWAITTATTLDRRTCGVVTFSLKLPAIIELRRVISRGQRDPWVEAEIGDDAIYRRNDDDPTYPDATRVHRTTVHLSDLYVEQGEIEPLIVAADAPRPGHSHTLTPEMVVDWDVSRPYWSHEMRVAARIADDLPRDRHESHKEIIRKIDAIARDAFTDSTMRYMATLISPGTRKHA